MRKSSILLLSAVFALAAATISAQETASSAKPAVAKTASAAEKEKPVFRGFLPPFYKDVVTPQQRDKIYKIQASYNETIRELEEQAKALRTERDLKIEQALTTKQLAEVKAKQQEAAEKRAEKALERKEATLGLTPPGGNESLP